MHCFIVKRCKQLVPFRLWDWVQLSSPNQQPGDRCLSDMHASFVLGNAHLVQRLGVRDPLALDYVVTVRRNADDGRCELGHLTMQSVECEVV